MAVATSEVSRPKKKKAMKLLTIYTCRQKKKKNIDYAH